MGKPEKSPSSGPQLTSPHWPRWIQACLLLVAAFGAGVLGTWVASPHGVVWDKLVAVIASLGTVAAASATYLTVQEMRAGRTLGARARVAPILAAPKVTFDWVLQPSNKPPTVAPMPIRARNASQGTARNIKVHWTALNPIDDAGLAQIVKMVAPNYTVASADGGYTVEYGGHGIAINKLVVSTTDDDFLGDLGPAQEATILVPVTVLNTAFLKWCELILQVSTGMPISPGQVPAYSVVFSHDSPYEIGITDGHVLRFHLVEFGFRSGRGRISDWKLGDSWRSLSIVLRADVASVDGEGLPTVAL